MSASGLCAHRGALLDFIDDPGSAGNLNAARFHPDGLLVVDSGKVLEAGPADALLARLPQDTPVIEHGEKLLMPGFVDTHIHYPQTDVIGSGGRELLDWLSDYTFPAERRFADALHAAEVAEFFLDELLRNGTTTALVFGTVHKTSVDAFMAAAERRGLRMIAGKVLMDRHCPEGLCDTVASGERESEELIEAWHGRGRLHYAITPRFAVTSSPAQLDSAARLAARHPEVYVQSHLAENHAEIRWVRELFPERRSYLAVYDHHRLLRDRAVYAHCIYLDSEDRERLRATGTCAAFCPTSNLYLGSGLFDLAATDAAGVRFAMGSDVGGGSSFSMLKTLGEGYKVAQLGGQSLPPLRAFYLATLGGARALRLDHRIGSFEPGHEADFVVIDPTTTPLLARRWAGSATLAEKLLLLMTLGDDRALHETYVLGRPSKPRNSPGA